MRQCRKCGMPMEKPEDFADGNPSSDICKYCAKKRGRPETEEEMQEHIKNILVRDRGMSEEDAEEAAGMREE